MQIILTKILNPAADISYIKTLDLEEMSWCGTQGLKCTWKKHHSWVLLLRQKCKGMHLLIRNLHYSDLNVWLMPLPNDASI